METINRQAHDENRNAQGSGYQYEHTCQMGKEEPVAMESLAKICVVLDCTLDDIVEINGDAEKGGE